eukprot:CAMPEP_0195519194 /NCGR_PEP_ID=MMETSP0794_2-20130614/14508_1 /TAXON_ID=515487 /ORGANISM="Stephanopyxis turris, Strain CCMP 815" /LENGTH=314 /DNA_ID=CAMNT_0040648309 /DNA_START=294 /DNA_END=1238 /DNA_ORIENTATION=+
MGPWAGNTCTPFRKLKSNSKRRRGDLDDLVQAGARSTTNFAFRLRGGGGDDEYYQHYGGGYGDDRENEEYYRRKGSGSSNGNRGRQNQGYDYDYRESGSSSSSRRSPQQGDYEYGSGDSRDGGQYYEGEEDYYGTAPARERSRRSSGYSGSTPLSSIPGMSNIMTKGNKKIGMSFSAGGLLFTLLGISLFFNKTLLRLGNLLFIVGIPLTIGPGRMAGYFLQPKKARATACLILGILLVLVGRPILGMILEAFGVLNLFGNMFPVVWAIVKNMPFVSALMSSGSGKDKKKQSRQSYRQDDDPYWRPAEDEERYY